MRYERHIANLERFQAHLGSIEARLVSLYPGVQGSPCPRQQALGLVDEDVVMGEATRTQIVAIASTNPSQNRTKRQARE